MGEAAPPASPRLLVIGDSLAFHGPERPELLTEARLWPNVAGRALGWAPDVVARAGWTSRDGWWAVTKDPRVWTTLADPLLTGVVIGVGSLDVAPASVPVWAREAIPYVRSGRARRRVRAAYLRGHPHLVRVTAGAVRQLPQRATEHYWTRIVGAIRHHRPDLALVLTGPSPWRSEAYPSNRHYAASLDSARRFAQAHDVAFVDLDPVVAPMHEAGSGNPDGLHYDWHTHQRVGHAVATAFG